MADTTIPGLQVTTSMDENTIIPIDSGIQTFKITAPNFAKYIRRLSNGVVTTKIANFPISIDEVFKVIPINSSAGSFNLTLPDPALYAGMFVDIKDIGGALSTYPVTLVRDDVTDQIEFLAANFLLEADFGAWRIYSDGTQWMFI